MDPPQDVIDDIMVKFVYNLGTELTDPVQLMFHLEHAWWYYEDTVRRDHPNLRHFSNYETFTNMLVRKVPMLSRLMGNDVAGTIKLYHAFKVKIPVYGAILMDAGMDRVLLVRGKSENSGWGFPKGKINHGETDVECACREVLEETGYAIDDMIKPGAYIEAKGANDKMHKLFIVTGLDPETAAFAPQLEGEIGAYGWHWLSELPATREDADKAYIASGGRRHKFYMVQPFISRLRSWVSKQRRQQQALQGPQGAGTTAAGPGDALGAVQGGAGTPGGLTPAVGKKGSRGGVTGAQAAPQQQPQQAQLQPSIASASGPLPAELLPTQHQQGVAGSGGAPAQRQGSVSAARTHAALVVNPVTPNLVLSAQFRFDTQAILRCLTSA